MLFSNFIDSSAFNFDDDKNLPCFGIGILLLNSKQIKIEFLTIFAIRMIKKILYYKNEVYLKYQFLH
jgi:hypothetical protein